MGRTAIGILGSAEAGSSAPPIIMSMFACTSWQCQYTNKTLYWFSGRSTGPLQIERGVRRKCFGTRTP